MPLYVFTSSRFITTDDLSRTVGAHATGTWLGIITKCNVLFNLPATQRNPRGYTYRSLTDCRRPYGRTFDGLTGRKDAVIAVSETVEAEGLYERSLTART